MRRALAITLLITACAEEPDRATRAPAYDPEVRAVLAARCARCHEGSAPAGAWRATTFIDAVACGAAEPDAGPGPSLARALDRADHAGYASAAERATLRAWVRGGARARVPEAHDVGFGDPRSTAFHAVALRGARWSPMLDASREEHCGRCHDGAPARARTVTRGVPDAPSCRTCHRRAEGALACDTCHAVEGPRASECPGSTAATTRAAHPAHLAQGFTCATCHPARTADFSRDHGDGTVQVVFDAALAGADARYDRATRTCTVACHSRGGARATPGWREQGPIGCDGCHGAPPAAPHPTGACNRCHVEAAADGRSLTPGPLHRNGRVDVGDGSEGCGACHGRGMDPWPSTGAHALHRDAPRARPVACESCHTVPAMVRATGHLDGVVQVNFSGPAVLRGATPTLVAGACANVACHGAGLRTNAQTPTLRWTDAATTGCDRCHGAPPAAPHPAESTCAALVCHGGTVSPAPGGFAISPAGRMQHVDGVVQHGGAP